MQKIFIIDAVNFLFRSYYAIKGMTNEAGQSTGAVYGFIRSIQKIFKDFAPTHMICVFDGPDNKQSRRAVYADYKMHRKGAPEDLFPQFEMAHDYCQMAGIPVLCVKGVEADDTMASVAIWARKHNSDVVLCSSDKDLMQLVDDHTLILQAHKDNLFIDAAKVEELFGVRPNQMLDLLAIMGDSSDNIPGLEGFGPKTAAALLKEFGTLDALLAHPEKVKGEKKQQVLRDQKDVALMSRQLATLDCKVAIPHEEEFYRLRSPDSERLFEFYHKMKFSSLIQNSPKVEEVKYHQVDRLPSISEKEVCIHLKTEGDHPMQAKIVGIGIAVKPGEAWYVPYTEELREFFKTKTFYGHNIKYAWHVLKNIGIEISISFDTLLASYLLDPQSRKHDLAELMLDKFKKVRSDNCCEDVDYICRLKNLFERELKGLSKLFYEVELPLLTILAHMEREGIYLDVAELQQLSRSLALETGHLKNEIFKEIGTEFNLNSPKQLSHVLFDQLAIPSKTTSTAAEVLEELAPEYPVVQKILEYRVLEKLRSTYTDFAINPETHRVHCTFNQFVAATGRLSCQDPNLQNIPVRSAQGLAIRACFKPRQGYLFLGADYSQIELRLLAHFSEDEELLKAFNAGDDIHAYTASLVFGVPLSAVEPEMRAQAKTVNFGILYGQGPYGLSKQLGISHRDAQQFINTYFERYPKVSAYLEQCREEVRQTGMAKTLTGRIRRIPDIHNQNPAIRAAAERLAINTPLQGTAADLIKMAMIDIDQVIKERKLEGKMILQIHDELIFEVPEDEIEEFKVFVKEKMETVFPLQVPIEVSIAVGKNWAEC